MQVAETVAGIANTFASTLQSVAVAVGLDFEQSQASSVVAWLAVFVVSLVTFGHFLNGVPLRQLGENTGAGVRTRLLGYDNIRGEFPHYAALLLVSKYVSKSVVDGWMRSKGRHTLCMGPTMKVLL